MGDLALHILEHSIIAVERTKSCLGSIPEIILRSESGYQVKLGLLLINS